VRGGTTLGRTGWEQQGMLLAGATLTQTRSCSDSHIAKAGALNSPEVKPERKPL